MKATVIGGTWSVVACVSLLAQGASAGDWSVAYGGNSMRTGQVDVVGPATPEVAWSGSLPSNYAGSPLIIGEGLLFADRYEVFGDDSTSFIVAHDLETGVQQWSVQLPPHLQSDAVPHPCRVLGYNDGVVYAVRQGRVGARLHALDARTGALLWSSAQPRLVVTPNMLDSPAFMPNGDLVIPTRGATAAGNGTTSVLARFSAVDGSIVWESNDLLWDPLGAGASGIAADGEVGFVWQDLDNLFISVRAFDLTTGRCLTEVPQQIGPPLCISFIDIPIFFFDQETGIEAGGFALGQASPVQLGPDGTIYAMRDSVGLFSLSLTPQGDIIENWYVPCYGSSFSNIAIGPDGSAYTIYRDPMNYSTCLICPDPPEFFIRRIAADGTVVRDVPFDITPITPYTTMIADADGKVYIARDETISCYNANLDLLWRESVPGMGIEGCALGADANGRGTLVVGGDGTLLRAYRDVCAADTNGDGIIAVGDILDYLTLWANGEDAADINGDEVVAVGDILDFLALWASGCAA